MVPSITQQLESMRHRFAETVLPALSADAEFAQEQAKLMLATFDWLLDTHPYQYRYVVVENSEYRNLLSDLVSLADAGVSRGLLEQARARLDEPGPAPDEARTPLFELADQTRRLKQLAMSIAAALQETDERGAACDLVASIARSQGARELAFFRMTGFTQGGHGLLSELDSHHE